MARFETVVARPAPLVDPAHEPRVDGIGEDVRHRGLEMPVRRDERVGEALAEEMASTAVPAVELPGVDAVKRLHRPRHARLGSRADDHEQVIVRVEQAPGDDAPADAIRHAAQRCKEGDPIEVAEEDRLIVDPPRGDVGWDAGVEGALAASHEPTVARPPARELPAALYLPTSVTHLLQTTWPRRPAVSGSCQRRCQRRV